MIILSPKKIIRKIFFHLNFTYDGKTTSTDNLTRLQDDSFINQFSVDKCFRIFDWDNLHISCTESKSWVGYFCKIDVLATFIVVYKVAMLG